MPNPPSKESPAVQRVRCPGCSADMEFDPQTGALKCSYCGSSQKVSHPVNSTVEELPFTQYANSPEASRLHKMSETAVEVTCTGCGSTIQFEPAQASGECPFCAAKIVTQPKAENPLIAPNGVLPFALPKERATGSVREWLFSRWFAPNGLKNVTRPEGIHGVYVPFWTFDSQTQSTYSGQRGDYYYRTESFNEADGRGGYAQKTRQVRQTRWTPTSGEVSNAFDDVLVAATKSISSQRLHDLDPWDLEAV